MAGTWNDSIESITGKTGLQNQLGKVEQDRYQIGTMSGRQNPGEISGGADYQRRMLEMAQGAAGGVPAFQATAAQANAPQWQLDQQAEQRARSLGLADYLGRVAGGAGGSGYNAAMAQRQASMNQLAQAFRASPLARRQGASMQAGFEQAGMGARGLQDAAIARQQDATAAQQQLASQLAQLRGQDTGLATQQAQQAQQVSAQNAAWAQQANLANQVAALAQRAADDQRFTASQSAAAQMGQGIQSGRLGANRLAMSEKLARQQRGQQAQAGWQQRESADSAARMGAVGSFANFLGGMFGMGGKGKG